MIERGRNLLVATSAGVLAVLAATAGCNSHKGGGLGANLRGTTPQQRVAMMFDVDDPDKRREGIAELSDEDWGLAEPYLKGYATLLEIDDNSAVRSAAARALGKAGQYHRKALSKRKAGPAAQQAYDRFVQDYVPALAAALSDEVASVRWDAAVALDRSLRRGAGSPAGEPLRKHAVNDGSTDVRIACATALRHCDDPKTLATLVECLDDKAFGVRYHAHASLVALTGQDLGYEPRRWHKHLGGAMPDSPSGQTPPAPRRRWWDWFGVKHRKDTARWQSDQAASQPADDAADPQLSR